MDEKEALKRQIELLQNLINSHKSVHGNAPSTSSHSWRPPRPALAGSRGRNMLSSPPQRLLVPLPAMHWKKTYSLSNKTQESERQPFSTSSTGFTSKFLQESRKPQSTSPPNQNIDLYSTDCCGSPGGLMSAVAKTGVRTEVESGSTASFMEEQKSRRVGIAVSMMGHSGMGELRELSTHETGDVLLTGTSADEPLLKTTFENKGFAQTSSYSRLQSSSQLHIRPRLSLTGATNEKQTVTIATSSNPTSSNDTANFVIASSVVPQQTTPSSKPKPNPSKLLFASSTRLSKFTWVKSHSKDGAGTSQTRVEPQTCSSSHPISACPAGTPGNASTPLSTKRALHKKVPRRLSLSTGASKTSKYTWVSSSAGAQMKLPRKPLSLKALTLPLRTLEKGDAVKKAKPLPSVAAKHRKGTGASTLSSRYSWKAGGQIGSGAGAGTAVLRRRSTFHWTSEGTQKGLKREKECPSLLSVSQPSSSPGGFKLRSRMKIVRRCASSAVLDRRTSPSSLTVSTRYSLRRRIHTPTRTHTQSKSPGVAKKTQARELVAFGRHKLRRLSANLHRTGHTPPSPRGPASQKVFRTRYKMVTRLAGAAAHGPHFNGPLSWRAKRIQSARNVLQGRLRAPHDRHPPAQHWKGRDMRWIGGSLYRVSANKLSRTVAASTSINRTGKWFGPHDVSPTASPSLARPSSTRHVASRAVQRSLAIIRHARQRKPQKQYCMYYNRFGKCNRGDSCPYIHDPDKVAVCTRFLRGTCKQTDGTCPFSHKVAKEKMPVCSYFLRGICNNSTCPYSHVYVSRKAAVCQDFLKGYCPQGEKCKKKHTLVCPDFTASGSCPRGSQCKLRHRPRAKHAGPHPSSSSSSSSSSSGAPAKRSHRTKRPRLCVVMPSEQTEAPRADPGTPASGPLKLPSFISLSSSPEDADAPDTPPVPAEVTERKLQIKPRL